MEEVDWLVRRDPHLQGTMGSPDAVGLLHPEGMYIPDMGTGVDQSCQTEAVDSPHIRMAVVDIQNIVVDAVVFGSSHSLREIQRLCTAYDSSRYGRHPII